ncbi:tyrosine-type recombinase/integrase [Sporosarcina sp. NPDC096371]|uniref:tyrosine-type recombinase/integrase n=1 Tax=Sporosarcina sp. NPDC096371 TaxID=3364530 RepID=UPI0038276D27
MKMRTVLEELEIYKKNVRLAKSTITTYVFYLKKFISFLSTEMNTNTKDIYLDKVYLLKDSTGKPLKYSPINSDIIDDYFLSLNNKSFNVLKDNYKSLMSFFKFLENNYSLANPLIDIKFQLKDYLPKKKFSKILTRGNILKLLNSITTHSDDLITDALLFTIIIGTGVRISEIINLKCNVIDYENSSFLILNTKEKDEKIIFLRPGTGYEIQKYTQKRNRQHSDYLFMKDNKKQYTSKDVNELLKKYLDFAKLPIVTVHALRHSFATLMADQGTPLDIIRQMLGHKSVSTTKGYINPHYVRNKNFNMPKNQIITDYLKGKI